MIKKVPFIALIFLNSFAWSQSIFSDGTWYKLGVTESGLYKINAELLTSLGVNSTTIDPKKIRIYGQNGGMLPQSNATFVYDDPPENALLEFIDNAIGLSPSEYLLFYANGPDKKKFDESGGIDYEKNIYSDTAYYFLTIDSNNGKRANTINASPGSGIVIDHFNEFLIRESEETNLISSGRRWFGDEFSTQKTLSRVFEYDLPGLRDSIHMYTRVITQSEGKSSIDISLNDLVTTQVPFDSIPTGSGTTYTIRAKEKEVNLVTTNNEFDNITLAFNYNRSNASLSRGFIDYFILSYERDLALYGSSTTFSSLNAKNGLYTFQIDPGSVTNAQIIDVTDPLDIEIVEFTTENSKAVFNADIGDEVQKYVVFHGSDFPTPDFHGTINNQNLKSSTQLDGIIITTPLLEEQAKRLQQFHAAHDNLSIGVINVNHIYNEFSSGRKDLTALRNYIKYVYQNGSNRLKNVLLMGDCSYDYKYAGSNQNHIPVYESYDSFSPIYSYSSDDYLGFLEDDEGIWIENSQNDYDMEVGVGRIPAKSAEEAETVVDKIIRYSTSERSLGKWRNEIAYFADDGDLNVHMNHAVTLSNIVNNQGPQFRTKKIFLDNFEQISNPRERSPAATKALEDAIADGLLVLNYIGHGNEFQWMEEETLNIGVISNLTNRHKLPLFVTATCEFGRYDHPVITSGGESLLLNPNGGAIGLITTTRPVYAHTNLLVNKAFHESLLSKSNGEFPTLGDLIRETKNNSLSGPVNRNFALLGDPFMRLDYPQFDITFGELESKSDTLSAFEEFTLYGAVISSGDTINNFNGKAIVTIVDIPQEHVTRGGQDNTKFSYLEFSNTLFRGEVTVNGGLFSSTFILPKNISYKLQNGKAMAYAWDDEQFLDATGANTNIVIGGTIANPNVDNASPKIKLYLNDESFVNGQSVGTNSTLIAKINDDSGINISSNGFNQNITLQLNDDEPFSLNDFYQSDLDTYKSGTIIYPLQGLDPGHYTASLKVWDTHNNSSIVTVDFNVSDQPLIRLYNVMNYPNPIELYKDSKTTFSFEHDREGEELIISIDIYDMTGSIKFTSEFSIDDSQARVDHLEWRPSNTAGGDLQQGMYLYRIKVKSMLDGASNEAIKRLIIIN
ncbi:MAG: type IX secretion system sortase PorU [Bacteroidota bacterium]